jgi:hypothetical protein
LCQLEVVGDGGCEAYTVIGWGEGLSHERKNFAEAETLGTARATANAAVTTAEDRLVVRD